MFVPIILSTMNNSKFSLKDMVRGWFVGNFQPSVMRSEDFEVAVKRYSAETREAKHMHKIADEITVIVSGRVIMNGVEYGQDDVIFVPKGNPTDFEALTDVVTVVVKAPSVLNDKYIL